MPWQTPEAALPSAITGTAEEGLQSLGFNIGSLPKERPVGQVIVRSVTPGGWAAGLGVQERDRMAFIGGERPDGMAPKGVIAALKVRPLEIIFHRHARHLQAHPTGDCQSTLTLRNDRHPLPHPAAGDCHSPGAQRPQAAPETTGSAAAARRSSADEAAGSPAPPPGHTRPTSPAAGGERAGASSLQRTSRSQLGVSPALAEVRGAQERGEEARSPIPGRWEASPPTPAEARPPGPGRGRSASPVLAPGLPATADDSTQQLRASFYLKVAELEALQASLRLAMEDCDKSRLMLKEADEAKRRRRRKRREREWAIWYSCPTADYGAVSRQLLEEVEAWKRQALAELEPARHSPRPAAGECGQGWRPLEGSELWKRRQVPAQEPAWGSQHRAAELHGHRQPRPGLSEQMAELGAVQEEAGQPRQLVAELQAKLSEAERHRQAAEDEASWLRECVGMAAQELQQLRQRSAAQAEEHANSSKTARRTTLELQEEVRAARDEASSLKECAGMAAQEMQQLRPRLAAQEEEHASATEARRPTLELQDELRAAQDEASSLSQRLAAQAEEHASSLETERRTMLELQEESRAAKDEASTLRECAAMAAQEIQQWRAQVGGRAQSLQAAEELMQRCAEEARGQVRADGGGGSTDAGSRAPAWQMQEWLASIGLLAPIADRILRPIQPDPDFLRLQLPYLRALGQEPRLREAILAVVQQAHGELASQIASSAEQLGSADLVSLVVEQGSQKRKKVTQELHSAAEGGSAEAVRSLVERAPDRAAALAAKDKYGYTPLHKACKSGSVEVVKALAELSPDKASVFAVTQNDGSTPLHTAAYNGHADVIRLLVSLAPDAAASLAAKDNNGWTLLHDAAYSGHPEAIKLLVELAPDVAAASLTTKGNNGFMPLHIAARRGHAEAIRALLHGASAPDRTAALAAKTPHGRTPLQWASGEGNDAAAEALRQMGAVK